MADWYREILPGREPHYADGSAALYAGDALRVLRELRPYSIGALVSDPPYSSGGLFREHVAEKPLAVMAWALGVVPSGAVVLDPFAGVGTTLLAAREQGLRAIGVEADPTYCALAARRLSGCVRGAANQEALEL